MTTKRHHMPFGADVADDGVTFAIYAPDVSEVAVLIEGEAPAIMSDGDGWKRVHIPGAKAGARYRFRLPDGLIVPDPAARYLPEGLAGPAEVIDPTAYKWRNTNWRGRPWAEAVIYELHVGAATPAGTYAALAEKLPSLAELGVTAIEIMPLAQWQGAHNWGYDGVLPFAPACSYGRPDDLKALIDRAHDLGLMVFLDVVYNHFGPSGNYLHNYAKKYFTDRHQTPWGAAINYDGANASAIRSFFINNAVYWVKEYHLDGLRLDAVHAIHDDSSPHILAEIAVAVRAAEPDRQIHLILENDDNEARWLERAEDGVTPDFYTAQWNDDAHHCWHTLLSGEQDGYYADFCDDGAKRLSRALAEGFVYQGDASTFRKGERRGERSSHLHPTAFIDFLQNHDQIGNRALGERIDSLSELRQLTVARSAILLSPHIPMLFMDEEWGATNPFLYFVDFTSEPDLARAVREGRQREFGAFQKFADGGAIIPDPNDPGTLDRSRFDAQALTPENAETRTKIAELIALRRQIVVPLLATRFIGSKNANQANEMIDVTWTFEAGALRMLVNLGEKHVEADLVGTPPFYTSEDVAQSNGQFSLPPWSIVAVRT